MFSCLGCKTAYEEELTLIISSFIQILGIVNNVFQPDIVQRQSRLKARNILAIPQFYMAVKCGNWNKVM